MRSFIALADCCQSSSLGDKLSLRTSSISPSRINTSLWFSVPWNRRRTAEMICLCWLAVRCGRSPPDTSPVGFLPIITAVAGKIPRLNAERWLCKMSWSLLIASAAVCKGLTVPHGSEGDGNAK